MKVRTWNTLFENLPEAVEKEVIFMDSELKITVSVGQSGQLSQGVKDISIKTPYSGEFVAELKKAFHYQDRAWDRVGKEWVVRYSEKNLETVAAIMERCFGIKIEGPRAETRGRSDESPMEESVVDTLEAIGLVDGEDFDSGDESGDDDDDDDDDDPTGGGNQPSPRRSSRSEHLPVVEVEVAPKATPTRKLHQEASSQVMRKAWQIRRRAAERWGCPVMEISWSHCLKEAWGRYRFMKAAAQAQSAEVKVSPEEIHPFTTDIDEGIVKTVLLSIGVNVA